MTKFKISQVLKNRRNSKTEKSEECIVLFNLSSLDVGLKFYFFEQLIKNSSVDVCSALSCTSIQWAEVSKMTKVKFKFHFDETRLKKYLVDYQLYFELRKVVSCVKGMLGFDCSLPDLFTKYLLVSIAKNYDKGTDFFIENGAQLGKTNRIKKIEASPLIFAASLGREQLVNNLLEKQSFQENLKDLDCALVKATQSGFFSIVKDLIKYGANVSTEENLPIQIAALNGFTDIVKFLLENGAEADFPSLKDAATFGYTEIVKQMIDYGAPISFSDYDYSTLENVTIKALIQKHDKKFQKKKFWT